MSAKTNIDDVNAKLAKMSKAARGKALETAVYVGLLPIEARAKAVVHKITATLARSIHIETTSDGETASGRVGTNVIYALREEYLAGGSHAYMRPSYDAEKDTAVEETAAALAEIVRKSAK